jgi:DNA-binding transcriptional ArsR family regulator
MREALELRDTVVRIDTAARWRAIGAPLRHQILQLLEDGRAWTVPELAQGLARTRQALYRHVHILEEAGVVRAVATEDSTTRYALAGRLELVGHEGGGPFEKAYAAAVDRMLRSVGRMYRRQPTTAGPVRGVALESMLAYLTEAEARALRAHIRDTVAAVAAARARSFVAQEPLLPYSIVVGFAGVDLVVGGAAEDDAAEE